MTMLAPRPGVWGNEARPGEIIEILSDGTRVFHAGAAFATLTGGRDLRLRRRLGYAE